MFRSIIIAHIVKIVLHITSIAYCTNSKQCIAHIVDSALHIPTYLIVPVQTEEISEIKRFMAVGKNLFFILIVCVWIDLKHLPDGRSLNGLCPG